MLETLGVVGLMMAIPLAWFIGRASALKEMEQFLADMNREELKRLVEAELMGKLQDV